MHPATRPGQFPPARTPVVNYPNRRIRQHLTLSIVNTTVTTAPGLFSASGSRGRIGRKKFQICGHAGIAPSNGALRFPDPASKTSRCTARQLARRGGLRAGCPQETGRVRRSQTRNTWVSQQPGHQPGLGKASEVLYCDKIGRLVENGTPHPDRRPAAAGTAAARSGTLRLAIGHPRRPKSSRRRFTHLGWSRVPEQGIRTHSPDGTGPCP